MSLFRRARNVVRNLWRGRQIDRDLDAELRSTLDLLSDEYVQQGLDIAAARRAAVLQLGGVESVKEQIREVRAGAVIDGLLRDLRYSMRMFYMRPSANAAAVGMLAIAIGLTSAMFTLVDALLLRPVPFREAHELARVWMRDEHGGIVTVAPAVLQAWRECGAFAAVESAEADMALLELDGLVSARAMARVTPGVFSLLGDVRPVRGRLFEATDAGRVSDRIVISEDLWRSLYHDDPDVVGRRITIAGESLTVIGVLPSEFRFPAWNTVIWRPADLTGRSRTGETARAWAFARFAKTMPRADAERLATAVARAADPSNSGKWIQVDPLAGMVLDPYYQRALPVLAVGVVLMFVVLCANVMSLLLARTTVRQREFSVRSALGASRARLLRQGLTDSMFLGAVSIAAGLGVGWMLVSIARAFLPEAFLIRTLNPLDLDARALVFTAAAGLVATIAAGTLPAWLASRANGNGSLRVCDRGATDSRAARSLMRMLLTAEIALACVLLVGATLLVRSFFNLMHAGRGLDSTGVIAASITLPKPAFPDAATRRAAARAIETELSTLAGVRQVTWSYGAPPDGGGISFGTWASDSGPTLEMVVDRYWVGPQFFALYRIPLLRGRSFDGSEAGGMAVVGERLARALWPDADPVGRSFSFGTERFQVIGVAREINHPSLDSRNDRPEFYEPFGGVGSYAMVSLRCDPACPDTALIRQRILRGHPAARVVAVRPLDDIYFEQLARPRAAAALALVFAIVATLAAAGGLFSILTYAVARRRREFGIRTALGASVAQIGRLVVRDGLVVCSVGLALGTAAALSFARVLASLEYGATVHDATSWMIVLALLVATTLLASWRPARHAMLVDPALLLKEE